MADTWRFNPASPADLRRVDSLVRANTAAFYAVGGELRVLHAAAKAAAQSAHLEEVDRQRLQAEAGSPNGDAPTKPKRRTKRVPAGKTKPAQPAMPSVHADKSAWFVASDTLRVFYRTLSETLTSTSAAKSSLMTVEDARRWVVLAWLGLINDVDPTMINGPAMPWDFQDLRQRTYDGRLWFCRFITSSQPPARVFCTGVTEAVLRIEEAQAARSATDSQTGTGNGGQATAPPRQPWWTRAQLIRKTKPEIGGTTFDRIRSTANVPPGRKGRKGRKFFVEDIRRMLDVVEVAAPNCVEAVREGWIPLVTEKI